MALLVSSLRPVAAFPSGLASLAIARNQLTVTAAVAAGISRVSPYILQSRNLRTEFKAEKPEKIKLLDRPIGSTKPPGALDNQGIDTRTAQERKEQMRDYQRHLRRREELKQEFAKSSFEDIYQFRDTGGKFWVAPGAYFKQERSLYLPNFWGRTLATFEKSGSTAVLKDKISIVRVFSSHAGEQQLQTYFDGDVNTIKEDGFQIVDINVPDSFVKEFFVKMFLRKLRKSLPDSSRHARYFISRKGVTPELRQSILAENIYGGYLYLVDGNCKIRWAAAGPATPDEKTNLWKFVRALQTERNL
ncbi:Atp10p [Sugiyamaella lignohabitans]|uniref:Atp10p n=1 Tax=Sugiyamaella lignohabitans TaxID=796027 RepID=A0A167C7V5_9ASCO|nr:Atp10p [Sugiyamaella lignohabitans]ANB11332.1 Atp10p [Sugiyamaella lignohabitans]